ISFLAVPHLRCMTAANDSVLHELDVEGDGHLVTDENTASLERSLQARPKSLRLIFVVAESSRRVLPQGSLAGGVGPSTVNIALRATLRMVRSPATVSSPLPVGSMRVDFNDSVGNFFT